jgi:hypothetical protein
MTQGSRRGRRWRALYVIEFSSYTNPRVWIRSFDHGVPYRNRGIAQQVADEATKKRGDKYRVVKYVRDWSGQ